VKGNVQQAWADRAKVIRAAIRLKHSLAADREINERLDEEKKKFDKEVLRGRLPKPLEFHG
jgi:hypothetical protein